MTYEAGFLQARCPSCHPGDSPKFLKIECDIVNIVPWCRMLQSSKDNGIYWTASYIDSCQARSSISWLSYADLPRATSFVTQYDAYVFLIVLFIICCRFVSGLLNHLVAI